MRKVTILGFFCLILILAALPFAACAEEAPVPVTPTPSAVPAAAGEGVFTVLNPVAKKPPIEVQGLSPRLDTLEGKTVNVINLHGGNEEAMQSVGPDLQAAAPGCNVVYLRTDGGFGGNPLTGTDWEEMTNCDAAIIGHGF